MLNDNQKDPRKNFAVRQLPWLLGAVMLVIYLFTINPWLSFLNLGPVAAICGFIPQEQLGNPIFYLATLPFRLLPVAKNPLLLNLFSVICSSLSLVILARCIAILPHDRTDTERQREKSDFSFLTGKMAIFPPLLAVLMVGMQFSFWEYATNFTNESLELLWFAGIVWLLLEYRLDEAPWRMYLAAFLCGAGIAESPIYLAYFPVFLTAVIWLRKMDFFNLQFLARMTWSGLAGILLLFLMPLITVFSVKFDFGLWDAMRPGLVADWQVISSISSSSVWHQLGLISMATFIPLFLISIRWSASFGDSSQTGKVLVNYLFYFVHAALFIVCVWVMFDPGISPRRLLLQVPAPFFGTSGLTLYFLAALGIGYFCGYYLLIFGKPPVRTRRNNRPDPALPKNLMWLSPVIVWGTFACGALAIVLVAYKNAPAIHTFNDNLLFRCAQLSVRNLPPNGAILLSDLDTPEDQPVHQYLVQAMLAREGVTQKYPVVDTSKLQFSVYHEYLHRRYPEKWPLLIQSKKPIMINQLGLLAMLNLLAQSNNICYLNPSFGYYFESFYQEPHGLNYALKPLPKDTLMPPPLDKNLIMENESFWSAALNVISPEIIQAVTPPDPNQHQNLGDKLLQRLHANKETDPNAIYAGRFYSRALNYWGVQLQRAGELDLAASNFITAQNLNPDNVNAGINLSFNRKLRTGAIPPVDLSRVNSDQFGQSRTWTEVLGANGPFDEPSFTFEDGMILAIENKLFRQALVPFTRVRQLEPNYLDVRLQLAQTYILDRKPDLALEALHDPLTHPEKFDINTNSSIGLHILLSAAYFQKGDEQQGLKILEEQIRLYPDDQRLITTSVQACLLHGLYANALQIITGQLEKSPNDPKWLFARGYAELKKTDYSAAAKSLSQVLDMQPTNDTARFNRALAYLYDNNLNAARADYNHLQTTYTNSVPVAYGLGEIAWRQHDTNEAIRNYRIYLANANTNTAEATNVITRLQELQK